MTAQTHDQWLDASLPRHDRLTRAVVSIVENVLGEQQIPYLAVSGRTKDKASALEKIKRKGYVDPRAQLTDLSGVRIVVYFESDIQRVAALVNKAFNVDHANSLDKESLLSTNQMGYRSVHFVCDLGDKRAAVDEYKGISDLKFEFQLRTVLQHAWAELAHDRNYKFSGKLPANLERKLFLYAGLLEIADKGFDETAKAIDSYADTLKSRTSRGDLDIEVTSLSLISLVGSWAKKNKFRLESISTKADLTDLVHELNEFGISKLAELDAIIPEDYASKAKARGYGSTIYGAVRDWMLINNWRKFRRQVSFAWVMDQENILDEYFEELEYEQFKSKFRWEAGEAHDEDAE
jgi:putative GTP pyrophosphokinase